MENIYHDAELLKMFAESNIKLSISLNRFLRKVRVPFLAFLGFWALWISQQVYALATLPHITYIVH